ncbi:hypothetical protein F3Y22_tig00111022pilonHSYRG00118 [Hibiscus syriacus]|uniref:DUF3700 domain-containing protein n=1 Tax=Hibiscus syriacus TaxID=106335 RepID=A0A6A2Z557_HIBSY|nr:hypothetical protein F3Y22_tig00111022pilonHSYRG00118 [Hibiscus syriacus]
MLVQSGSDPPLVLLMPHPRIVTPIIKGKAAQHYTTKKPSFFMFHKVSGLLRQYGLSRGNNEAMFIIAAYRTLRDRGPYPADRVLKDLEGSYGVFHSERGLMSYEHPRRKMKAIPRIDSEEAMCVADFKADVQSRIGGMRRAGSEANWALRGSTA